MIKELVRQSLPDYIIDNDSYKDVNGKGFVERYLEIFGEELDDEYVPKIENLINQRTPLLADSIYLDYLAVAMGDLPNISQDTAHYRNLISSIIAIWRIKGTKKSYQWIFYSLGLYNTVINEVPVVGVAYDESPPLEYDDDPLIQYDVACPTCSDYSITTTGLAPLTAELYNKMLDLVSLVEPINAKLLSITYNGDLIEELYISVTVDENGDLVYDNANDPDLVLSLDSNGNLIISGPQASRYFVNDNGDLIYLLF